MALAPVIGVAMGLSAGGRQAKADDADKTAFNERCASRLAISILGTSPTADMLAAADPQSLVDTMLKDPAFIERFSTFINSQWNRDPGQTQELDSAYFLSKYVLTNGKPWSDIFLGQYKVDLDATGKTVQVTADPEGLGYFRSMPWLKRYAGNEPAGIKISTAYRIMQNTIGLTLVASTNAPGADISATGRQAAPCNSCHFDNWYALDKTAGILSKKITNADKSIGFQPYTGGPQTILGGVQVSDDKSLVQALVASENYPFNTCRLAFQYLYGRAENQCEGPVFDSCVSTFKAQGTIQSALSVVAKDPGYCQ